MDRRRRDLIVIMVSSMLITVAAIGMVAALLVGYLTGNYAFVLIAAVVLLVVSLASLPGLIRSLRNPT